MNVGGFEYIHPVDENNILITAYENLTEGSGDQQVQAEKEVEDCRRS